MPKACPASLSEIDSCMLYAELPLTHVAMAWMAVLLHSHSNMADVPSDAGSPFIGMQAAKPHAELASFGSVWQSASGSCADVRPWLALYP